MKALPEQTRPEFFKQLQSPLKHMDTLGDNNQNVEYAPTKPRFRVTRQLSAAQKRWQTVGKRVLITTNLFKKANTDSEKHRDDLATKQAHWVQLAGHEDSFAVGEEGTILKKLQSNEERALRLLMEDPLKPYVPEFKGIVQIEDPNNVYIEMQDLLHTFTAPSVMDCKMGIRTYLEDELVKLEAGAKPRKDMYEKMVKIDPSEPTSEEHKQRAVSKPRYMQWRERYSSSHALGFRIEGIKKHDGETSSDFKSLNQETDIMAVLESFCDGDSSVIRRYIHRLNSLIETLQTSTFFSTHEVIGSSLLFVHDETDADIWMIDFGKTPQLPTGVSITHNQPWVRGNHEDGYLTGIANILRLLTSMIPQ